MTRADPLLDGLLDELGQGYWPPRFGAELAVGGPEIQYAIAVRDGETSVEQVERGVRQPLGRFSDRDAAYRYLVLVLAEELRARRGRPRIEHRHLAPDTLLTDGPDGQRLTWPEGWAVFPAGELGAIRARPYSWVARREPRVIVESYGRLDGEPLFDLGITDRPPSTSPVPRRSTLRPRPAETPPPDPSTDTEVGVALAAAAEIGWDQLPAADGDLLVVGRDDVGRVIGYRLGMFEYASFVGDHRAILSTTSAAAAARRLLVIEVASLARTRRRQQPVHLRVRGPAPDFTVTKGPTEFVVQGHGVSATFPLGPVGQQQALVFTWCAAASLPDILASYRDPDGAPLLPRPA